MERPSENLSKVVGATVEGGRRQPPSGNPKVDAFLTKRLMYPPMEVSKCGPVSSGQEMLDSETKYKPIFR